MTINLQKLDQETLRWLDETACSHGTSIDLEAQVILGDAVHERIRRERLLNAASTNRIRVPGPPITAEEIEEMINWGRA